MRCASLVDPTDIGRPGPVTQLIRAIQSLPQDDTTGQGGRDAPRLPLGEDGGRKLMRRIIIAAAIASALIALWAVMLPLAA